MTTRRHTLALSIALGLSALSTGTALAQDAWPSKPIRLVVPFSAGGTSDILARTIGEKLQAALKQTIVIDNKAGAGGVIGADLVAKSPPDGYTMLIGTISSNAINPALQPKMPYNAATDFAPVILLGSISNVLLVGADQPYKTVKDLIAAAKAKPGDIAFASAGQGSSQHMSGELFKLLAGAELMHVPYKGSQPAMMALLAGEVDFSFETTAVALPQIRVGKLKALATPSPQRLKELPNVPTLVEAGFGDLVAEGWMGVFAPAGTPAPIVQRLNQALGKVLRLQDVQDKLADHGVKVTGISPQEYRTKLAAELQKWRHVVAGTGITLTD